MKDEDISGDRLLHCEHLEDVLQAIQVQLCQKPQRNSKAKISELGAAGGVSTEVAAKAVAHDSILRHPNPKVRSAAGAVLAEVLRICAPDAPFDHEVLLKVFSLFLRQISGLSHAEDELHEDRLSLLVVLSRIEAFSLVRTDTDWIVEAIPCLLQVVQPESLDSCVEAVTGVLCTLITEANPLSTELVEAILEPAQRPDLGKHPRTVVFAVIQRCQQRLAEPACQYLEPKLRNYVRSRRKEQSFERLVTYLAMETRAIGERLMPHVTYHLNAPDSTWRTAAFELVAESFAKPGANFAAVHPDAHMKLLGRHADVEPTIRRLFCSYAGRALLEAGSGPEAAAVGLGKRLMDSDETVRCAAVQAVFGAFQSDSVGDELVRAAARRLLDKKVSVRLASAAQLSVCLRRHWQDSDAALGAKVGTAVGQLCEMYRVASGVACDTQHLTEVLNVPVVGVMNVHGTPADQARSFMFNVGRLSEDQLAALSELVELRSRVRANVLRLIKLRKEGLVASESGRALLLATARLLQNGGWRSTASLSTLFLERDLLIFSSIETAVRLDVSAGCARSRADDAVKRVGSKSELGKFLRKLIRLMRPGVFTGEFLVATAGVLLAMDEEQGEAGKAADWIFRSARAHYADVAPLAIIELSHLVEAGRFGAPALRLIAVADVENCDAESLTRLGKLLHATCLRGDSRLPEKLCVRAVLRVVRGCPDSSSGAIGSIWRRVVEILDDFDFELLPRAFPAALELCRGSSTQPEAARELCSKMAACLRDLWRGNLFSPGDPVLSVMTEGIKAVSRATVWRVDQQQGACGDDAALCDGVALVSSLRNLVLGRTELLKRLDGPEQKEALRTEATKALVRLTRESSPLFETSLPGAAVEFIRGATQPVQNALAEWVHADILKKRATFRWISVIVFSGAYRRRDMLTALVRSLRAAVAQSQLAGTPTAGVRSTVPFLPESVVPSVLEVAAKDIASGNDVSSDVRTLFECLIGSSEQAAVCRQILVALLTRRAGRSPEHHAVAAAAKTALAILDEAWCTPTDVSFVISTTGDENPSLVCIPTLRRRYESDRT